VGNKILIVEDLLKSIDESYKAMDDVKIFYTLKKLRVRINGTDYFAFKVVKALLACYENGFKTVTTGLLRNIICGSGAEMPKNFTYITHRLGDYHLIIMLHSDKLSKQRSIRWQIHPRLLGAYYGDKIE